MCYELSFAHDLPPGHDLDEVWGTEEAMNVTDLGLALCGYKEHSVSCNNRECTAPQNLLKIIPLPVYNGMPHTTMQLQETWNFLFKCLQVDHADWASVTPNRCNAMPIMLLPIKGALYRIWCGVNRLGDSGVKVVSIDSAVLLLLLSRRVSYC